MFIDKTGMNDRLNGKTVLITGAAKRMGRQIALSLAGEGMNVVIHYRSSGDEAAELKERLASLGVKSWTVQEDFKSETNLSKFIQGVKQEVGDLNCLVNNASIFPSGDLEDIEFNDLLTNLKVNLWAPLSLSRSFVNNFEGGKIVNLLDTRVAGYDWDHAGYYFSKVLLTRMTKMTALKYAPDFTVNGVAPGLITPPPGSGNEYLEERVDRVPLGRYGRKSDVADAVTFLLQSTFITGQILYVDGGRKLLHEQGG
ncbi:SDR family oxidoreductase [Candidatus Bipolaricaulota bacterium]|nr:SDR family oxidoreductase [Candidatus Bipolaricaulota bacterium]